MKKLFFSIVFTLVSIIAFTQTFNPGSVSNRVAITDAGDYMVFQSNLLSGYQIYESRLDGKIWSAPRLLTEINLPFHGLHSMGHVTLNGNGDLMVFSARTDNSKKFDLFYSVRNNGAWARPVTILNLNTEDAEVYPTLHPESTELFFLRNQKGNDSCLTLYKCNISNKTEFSLPQKISDACMSGIEILKDAKTLWVRSEMKIDTLVENMHLTTKIPFVYNKKALQITSSIDDTFWYISDGKTIQTHTISPEEHTMGIKYNSTIKSTDAKQEQMEGGLAIKKNGKAIDSLKIKNSYSFYLPAYSDDTLIMKYDALGFQSIYDTIIINKRQAYKTINKELNFKKRKKKYVFNVSDSENDKSLSGKIKVINKITGEEEWLEVDPSNKGAYSVYLNEGEEYSVEVTNVKGYSYKNESLKVGMGGNEAAVNQQLEVERLVVGKNFELKNIYFEYNSFVLNDSSAKELNLLLELMEVNPEMKIRIEAHTDGKGNAAYNKELSNKRAQSVVDYLISKGVAIERLAAEGFGSTMPKVKEIDEATKAQNRRVEIKIQAI